MCVTAATSTTLQKEDSTAKRTDGVEMTYLSCRLHTSRLDRNLTAEKKMNLMKMKDLLTTNFMDTFKKELMGTNSGDVSLKN